MKRADLEKRAQRDKFGAGKHGFQSGNPAGGLLPTIPGAEWFDHTQEEICAVIEAAGLTVDPSKYNQMLTALRKIIDEQASDAVKTTSNQDIAGIKSFTNALHAKASLLASDSVADFAANRYLKLGADNTSGYLTNQSSGKSLSLLNNGELHYDGKRVAMLPDLSNVSRRDYSREQTPVNPVHASERYKTEGSVSVYPDGRIVQTFWLKVVAHTFWLPEELPGFQVASANDVSVALPLWTAMPNKVTNVQVQPLRCSDPNKSQYYYAEAAELPAAWALRKQKDNKNTVWLDIGRIAGSIGNDRIDIFVNVEGY